MRRVVVLVLACMVFSPVTETSQTRRRSAQKRPSGPTFAEKQQAEIQSGREQIAAQIKALTQFLYLFGGISKNIETAERANTSRDSAYAGMSAEQLAQSKVKVKNSIASVRAGLGQLESSFSLNPVLQSYYPSLAGVAKLAQEAESQVASNNLDQAGSSLIAVVNKLTDALVALH